MNIGELKKQLENIPNDVEVTVTDMNGEEFDFQVSTSHDEEQNYLEFIIPIWIHAYNYEGECNTINLL